MLGISPSSARWVLALFLGAFALFRFYYIQSVPLSEDEAYYWDWSRRLAWGYFDQGPLVAWMIRMGTWLFGHTELGVRFMAVVCSLGMSLVIYDFCARLMTRPLMGLFLVASLNLSLFFSVGALLMTYDTPQALFWALSLYCIARAIFQERPLFWYLGGIAVGLAMLSKYTSGLIPLLTLAFLLTSRDKRGWLARKEPWLACLIALLLLLPNLIWNLNHHWAAFGNTLRHASGSGFNFTLFEFVGGQAGLVGPILFGFMIIGLFRAWKLARRGDALLSFLLWTSLPVLLIFTLLSIQSRMQANWPAVAYLGAMPAAAFALWPSFISSRRLRCWGGVSLILGFGLVMLASFPSPLVQLLDIPKDNNPFSKLYGWDQIGPPIAEGLESWPQGVKPFIFGSKFQLCALAAFYGPGKPQVESVFLPGRLNQYVYWSDPARLKGKDGLGVFESPRNDLDKYFKKVQPLKHYKLYGPWGGHIHDVVLYRCTGFLGKDHRPDKYLDVFQK
jgi:4-amino-4-deoxy-L-arabinose transferase-like glycosyltransferase